jgi:hypothetical protein
MRMVLQRLYIIEVFNLFDSALNLALRKVTCQWRFRLSFPRLHTYKCAYYSQYQDWLTKSVLGICQSWRWLCIWAWSNKILMLFASWRRKMSIVLFEQDALGWSTRVFVRSVGVDLITLCWCKSYVTASMGDIWMCILKTLFNKIAGELFGKTHLGFELWC